MSSDSVIHFRVSQTGTQSHLLHFNVLSASCITLFNGLRPMPTTPIDGHRYRGHGCLDLRSSVLGLRSSVCGLRSTVAMVEASSNGFSEFFKLFGSVNDSDLQTLNKVSDKNNNALIWIWVLRNTNVSTCKLVQLYRI